MNKKFLNAVLFGALLASSTGTFTSCKDYDDDINGLNERVDAVEKTLADLNTKFGALAYVKSVSFADGKLVVTDQSGITTTYNIPDTDTNTTYTLAVTQDGNKATITLTDSKGGVQSHTVTFTDKDTDTKFDPSALTVGKDGVTIEYNGQATGVKIPISKDVKVKVIKGEVDGVVYGWSITNGTDSATNLMICDVLPITGFSFEPDVILGGVPSMKALSVEYYSWDLKTDCSVPSFTGEVWEQADKSSYISPVITGTYHLNPSSATREQITSIEVISKDFSYITRAADAAPSVLDDYSVADGILTVHFKADVEKIKAIENNQITGFKIRVKTKAGNSITDQDYRGVYTTKYTNLVLGDKDKQKKGLEEFYLYGTATGKAADAIDADPDYEVAYNSPKGLDLKPLVITCYGEAGIALRAPASEQILSDKDMESLGLSYAFHLCNYIAGDNQTKQNDFARIEGGVLYPKLFDETGEPFAAVGRMPLVRVQLMTKDNKVASTGWIKVKIVKEKISVDPIVFDFNVFTNQCSDKEFKLSVEQMNVKVYNKLGMNRNQFNAAYKIKEVEAGNYGKGAGIVTLGADPTNPTMTDLLTWTIGQEDMKEGLAGKKASSLLTTSITYTSNDPEERGDVTITFNSTVNAIKAVTIPADNKIAEYWDANKEYIRLNVAVPQTQSSDNCTFVVDLDNVFAGGKPKIDGVTAYRYIFDGDKNKEAEGLSGKKYTLTVKSSGTQLYADAELVATINSANGEVTYAETAASKDLLNKASHSSIPNGGFFAWINIKAVTGDCELELPITNGIFKAYFMRPIDVTAGTGRFQDAVDGGSVVKMLDLLKFNDWREKEFGVNTNATYFKFYEITAISIDIPNITTDLNGGNINNQKLKDVAPTLKVTDTPIDFGGKADIPTAPTANAYGTVTYTNNGSAVGAFNLRLPVTVTYKWGTVKAYVTIPVEKTQGN